MADSNGQDQDNASVQRINGLMGLANQRLGQLQAAEARLAAQDARLAELEAALQGNAQDAAPPIEGADKVYRLDGRLYDEQGNLLGIQAPTPPTFGSGRTPAPLKDPYDELIASLGGPLKKTWP